MAETSDIAVIGSGVIGCAIAWKLAARGASVTMIDDRAPGMGATQASAGVLAPYIEARDGGPLIELTARSGAMYDRFLDELTDASDVRVPHRRTGTLDVALGAEAMSRLERASRELWQKGVTAELLDAHAVLREEPHLSRDSVGGLLIPCHGFVAAGELTRALVLAATRLGARPAALGRALRVVRAGSDLAIETERGRVTAGRVVLAAGAWAGTVAIEGVSTPVPIRPIRGQLLQLAWTAPPLRRVTWGERCYVVPWADGTLLVGATVEDVGFDERTTTTGVGELLDAVCELLPEARGAGFTAARAGLRPASPDHLPVVGASTAAPGLVYATGHYRNGILLAPLTARLVANIVCDGLTGASDPVLALMEPQRFGRV